MYQLYFNTKYMNTPTKTDWEVIQDMDQYEKNLFIDKIISLFTNNHMLEHTKGGFAELFSVYIQSPEFNRLDDERKTDFLQVQFEIYDMFNFIEYTSMNYSIGKYSKP